VNEEVNEEEQHNGIAAEIKRRDLSVDLLTANVYGTLAGLLPALILAVAFVVGWGWRALFQGLEQLFSPAWLFLLLLIGGIVVHEALHGLTWMVAGRKSRDAIKFGVAWEKLTPYAHSKEPMPARAYRLGAFMPGLLLGLLPCLVAVAVGDGALFIFGWVFTVAAGGDFLVLWLLRGVSPREQVEDHPSRAGCYVLEA
jgi:hypothetical protein